MAKYYFVIKKITNVRRLKVLSTQQVGNCFQDYEVDKSK